MQNDTWSIGSDSSSFCSSRLFGSASVSSWLSVAILSSFSFTRSDSLSFPKIFRSTGTWPELNACYSKFASAMLASCWDVTSLQKYIQFQDAHPIKQKAITFSSLATSSRVWEFTIAAYIMIIKPNEIECTLNLINSKRHSGESEF